MKSGTSTGGVETSPRYQRKKRNERAAEEARWKELNGPVVSYVDESVRRGCQSAQHGDRAAEDTSE